MEIKVSVDTFQSAQDHLTALNFRSRCLILPGVYAQAFPETARGV